MQICRSRLPPTYLVHFQQVLHVDRNNYYGGDCASLNLTNLYAKFRPGQAPAPELGHPTRDYNVDLIPKFLMANGDLVKMLLMTKVRPMVSRGERVGLAVVYAARRGRVLVRPNGRAD